MADSWRCDACNLALPGTVPACPLCGAKPPAPFAVGATLHFTGVRIPKED